MRVLFRQVRNSRTLKGLSLRKLRDNFVQGGAPFFNLVRRKRDRAHHRMAAATVPLADGRDVVTARAGRPGNSPVPAAARTVSGVSVVARPPPRETAPGWAARPGGRDAVRTINPM